MDPCSNTGQGQPWPPWQALQDVSGKDRTADHLQHQRTILNTAEQYLRNQLPKDKNTYILDDILKNDE